MKPPPQLPHALWIRFNAVLFSGYVVFDIVSFFWPNVVKNCWITLFYVITFLVNSLIVYGLIKKTFMANYLVAVVSFFMAVHLFIFVLHPIGMQLAYVGPSRAFYSLFISLMSQILDKSDIRYSMLAFNLTMICVHVINIFYFTRKRAAALFMHDSLNDPPARLKEQTA